MFINVLFATCLFLGVRSAVIPHHYDISHTYPYSHGHATSYQSVKISNYHHVPIYLKKEHQQYLAHPVESGHTSTSVQVHHIGDHDHGYAVVGGQHHQQESGQYQQEGGQYQQEDAHGEYEQDLGGYEHLARVEHGQQQDLNDYDAADLQDHQGQGLQAYATHGASAYEHAGQETSGGYEQEAAGYEHHADNAAQHHYQ